MKSFALAVRRRSRSIRRSLTSRFRRGRTIEFSRATARAVENLENRLMMAVGLDGNGWTQITPASDTRTIYVSSSAGSDSNSGLSASSPVKSISKGVSLLRDGSPDWLLLKKGDAWHESFPTWWKSGRDAQNPMVVSSYGSGTARPDVKAGSGNGIYGYGAWHDVAFIGLHLEDNARNPDSPDFTGTAGGYGFQVVGPVKNLLLEDNQIDHFRYNVSIQGYTGYTSGVQIRRNVITDSYDPGVKSEGIYLSQTGGTVIDGNVLDHNGWNEKIAGATPNLFSHNIYMWETNNNAVVRNNIIANAASHGLQARGGAIIENNLFLKNPIGAQLGNGSHVHPGGVSGRITGNVFVDSRDIAGSGRGWAIELGNIKAGGNTVVSDNVITNDTQNQWAAIKLEHAFADNQTEGAGINDVTIERNIVSKWASGVYIVSGYVFGQTGYNGINGLVVRDNDFQNTAFQKIINHNPAYNASAETWSDNRYYNGAATSGWFSVSGSATSLDSWKSKVEPTAQNQKITYADPGRTAASYNQSLGGTGTLTAFLSNVRQQGKATWNPAYTAAAAISYIRAGFTGGVPQSTTGGTSGGTTGGTTGGTSGDTTGGTTGGTTSNAAPTANLSSAADVTTAGGTTYQFNVTYADDSSVMTASFGSGDIKVTLPDGSTQAASFVKADNSTNGTPRTATYQITAPGGTWDSADNGTYTLNLNANGVRDVAGVYAAADMLGTFKVNVAAPVSGGTTDTGGADTTPPTVVSAMWDPQAQTITMHFSEDVSMSLNASDLQILNVKTWKLLPTSEYHFSYDKATKTAVWSFTDALPVSDYWCMLGSSVVWDGAGNTLDGNADGIGAAKGYDDYFVRILSADMEPAAGTLTQTVTAS